MTHKVVLSDRASDTGNERNKWFLSVIRDQPSGVLLLRVFLFFGVAIDAIQNYNGRCPRMGTSPRKVFQYCRLWIRKMLNVTLLAALALGHHGVYATPQNSTTQVYVVPGVSCACGKPALTQVPCTKVAPSVGVKKVKLKIKYRAQRGCCR
jgi:hypothetical protein